MKHLLSLLLSGRLLALPDSRLIFREETEEIIGYVWYFVEFFYAFSSDKLPKASVFNESVHPSVRDHTYKIVNSMNITNRSSEFHQIYHLGAVGGKGELVRVWGQKVRSPDHDEIKYADMRNAPFRWGQTGWLFSVEHIWLFLLLFLCTSLYSSYSPGKVGDFESDKESSGSAGASLSESLPFPPLPSPRKDMNFSAVFWRRFFSCLWCSFIPFTYPFLGVTLPVHLHLRPFTTTWDPFTLWWAYLPWRASPVGGTGWSAPALPVR